MRIVVSSKKNNDEESSGAILVQAQYTRIHTVPYYIR